MSIVLLSVLKMEQHVRMENTLFMIILNGGVGNYGYNDRYYWISSSFNSTYTKRIKNAVRDWVYTTDSVGVTTPISLVNTSTKSQSVFDVYPSDLGNRILGLTQFYLHGGSSVDPEKKIGLIQRYILTQVN